MKGSFHLFLEHLINSTYQHQRIRLSQSKLYGKVHSYASSYISFGGWEINYNGKGWTRLFIEKVGNIEFVSKTIHLTKKLLTINYTPPISSNSLLVPSFKAFSKIFLVNKRGWRSIFNNIYN